MVDGPHKTLNMSPAWKKVAERAANNAYTLDEVGETEISALAQDWKLGVPDSVIAGLGEALNDQQECLFKNDLIARLEPFRRRVVGSVLGQALIDCVIQDSLKGKRGQHALLSAAKNALAIRNSAGVRQVEEHYHRKWGPLQAAQIRRRLEKGCADAAVTALARKLVSGSGQPSGRPIKKRGLDDGVAL